MKKPSKIGYFIGRDTALRKEAVKKTGKALKKLGIPFEKADPSKFDGDLIMVFGGDGTMLQTVRLMGTNQKPVLGVNCGALGFLTEVNHKGIEKVLPAIARGDYTLEKRDRLQLNGKNFFAVNEIVVCPVEAATLMRYSLKINGEMIWRDSADGIVVSTATGSTAYALSVGGAIIAHDSKVFEVVPINSINHSRRGMVLPLDAKVEITGIESPVECKVILDGKNAFKSGENLEIKAGKKPALFVKIFPSYSSLSMKMRKKVDVIHEQTMRNEPPASKFIVKVIEMEGPLTQKEIIKATGLPARTARRNLKNLIKKGVVVKKTLLEDPRQSLYLFAD
jgi:NAD+ kinase